MKAETEVRQGDTEVHVELYRSFYGVILKITQADIEECIVLQKFTRGDTEVYAE